MSANGVGYNAYIAWTYSSWGTSSGQAAISSSFAWDRGNAGDSRSGFNVSYSHGPTTETGSDTVVSPPGGIVSVQVHAAVTVTSYPPSSGSAGASGNGTYTP
jgi:hypothetical protein